MGNTATKQEIVYSKPISQPKEGESAVYRDPEYPNRLTVPKSGWTTIQQLYLEKFRTIPDNEWLGRRDILPDGTLAKEYTWETFAQVEVLARLIGSGIINLGLTEVKSQYQNFNIKFVSIYAGNSREWILVDCANMLYGNTTMPLYDFG